MNSNLPQSISLSELTTLKVGGPARVWQATTESELQEAISYADARGENWRILGGGSNILAPDEGTTDIVIKMAILGTAVNETDDQVLLTVGAGESFDEVVATAVAQGWWGLENLSHIPGSVGATPVQNVGAYGVEVRDIIESVRVYDAKAESWHELTPADCHFAYRNSIFKQPESKHLVVTAVTFRLSKLPKPVVSYRDLAATFPEGTNDVLAIREAVIDIRSRKFPDWTVVGTAGSFFKNPIITNEQFAELRAEYPETPGFPVDDTTTKVPLGYILDKILQLRGIREGAVGTYEGQALVLVNDGGATASDIAQFAESIGAAVFEKLGITIEWEVTRWTT